MRSVIFRQGGDAAVVAEVDSVADPNPPQARQISVRVGLSPVHRGDLVGAERTKLPPGAAPARMGSEAVGTVTAVGEGVTHLRDGDRVAVFPAPGAWSEQLTLPAEAAVKVPDTVSDEAASIMLVNTITSREILRAVQRLREDADADGDVPLIISAAASAVGKLLVQQATDRGWPVVAVVRSERSAGMVRDLFPAVPVVVTATAGWQEELRAKVHGRLTPVIADAHGGAFVEEMLPFLADAGTVVVWGDLAAQPWTLSTSELLDRELRIRAVSISRWMTRPADVRAGDMQAAAHMAAAHQELLAIATIHPLDDLKAAIHSARHHGAGTTLLNLDHDQ
ncbi:zinc-binding dehydrogenase [Streptomyces sp. NPDC001414]